MDTVFCSVVCQHDNIAPVHHKENAKTYAEKGTAA
jgi:hypothetical protein